METLEENDVVISGVSGVFPKSDNLEEFAEKLFAKEDLLSKVPHMPCKLGKLKNLSKFDAEFFNFQPHRVDVMDPMARIILEKAYEAIVDSGNNPVTFRGKNCGVFVGIHFLETEVLVYEKIQKGASLAISRSFNANRISYWLGIHGPSFTVDSACSSTLLALEMAYKAIRSGECESALVGGCHVCLHPALLLHLLKVGALNSKGESRVFDEHAGGFCKAEAIGIFYLQKAKDAKRVYAKVINVRSNHDGSKPLFLSPHGPSQAKLLKMVYEESSVDINSVSWIEAHATGTLVGDKQEVNAIDEVFKNRQNPLLIGSVKSNMGHAEAAAAVGSISKILIAMQTNFIPPNINISNVRKDIEAFASGRIKVITEKTPWDGGIVGVSGFGMGGANTHAILKSFTKEKVNNGIPDDDLPRIVGFSGRTEEALQVFIDYLNSSNMDAELIALLHEIYNFDVPLHSHRGYIILSKNKTSEFKKLKKSEGSCRPLWFAFSNFETDISSIFNDFKNIEIFRNIVQSCSEILKLFGLHIIEAFENKIERDVTSVTGELQTIIIQLALAELMKNLNVSPDNVVGKSFGCIVRAYLDKSLTLDQTLKVAYYVSTIREESRQKELKTIIEKIIEPETSRKNRSLIDYLVDSPSNADYVQDILENIPESVIVVSFSSDEFSKTLKESLKGQSIHISAIKNNQLTFFNFISVLGELYLLGKNPYFQKLYTPVNFPVSRSTKMIAPLIKWKHDVDWPVAFSSFQERMLSGERKVSVSLDDKTESYISGHEVDSNVLYPGTGYLVLAWDTLAMIHGKMFPTLPVVIENVRFHKATVVPQNDPITFNVMVQKGTGNFEILENNHLVTSGRIYVPNNVRKEMLDAVKPPKSEIILDGMDFYRYILIRNYNYKGAFRSIKKINIEGTQASVAWIGNWVTYLDGMLQLNMLAEDADSLSVPVEIEKIIIDTDKHEQLLQSNPVEFDVYMDKNLNLIHSGGVQIKGCVLRPIPWKLPSKAPLVQKLLFSPFSSHEQKLSLKNVVQLFGQCFLDNIGQNTENVKVIEIIDEDSNLNYSLVTPFLCGFMKEQPLFKFKSRVFLKEGVKAVKMPNGFDIVNGKLPLGEAVQLLICSHALKNPKKLEDIANSLTDDGFVITREDACSSTPTSFHFQVCGDALCNDERFVFLRKKIDFDLNSFKIIKVSAGSFEWIQEVQEALSIAIYERIILVSENEPFSGILGFFNCLRLERGTQNVRCFFIMDDELEHFSLKNKFFRTQLLKDLAVNIYKGEEWGCYVKYAIDDVRLEKVHHAAVIRRSNGVKPSLQWCKGDIDVRRNTSNSDSEKLIQVFYATVNSTDVLLFKNRLATKSIVKDSLKQDYALGMEFSGRTKSGNRCMGLRSYGCLSTLIERDENDLFFNHVPENWSLEEAATVPLAYYTAIYALVICGKLKNKDTVLIHSAGSIISQAAIHIAIHYNCNIFVTISSVDEKLFIKENFPYISESKIGYTDSFEQMIKRETNNGGAAIILNSLVDEKLLVSINCLASCGKFVQIKKADFSIIGSHGNKLLLKNASLHSALLEDILQLPRNKKIELRNSVNEHIQNGAIKPLPRTIYCYTGVESAFEFASSTRNLGKCVIQIEPEERFVPNEIKLKKAVSRVICDPEKSYLVCGGLGGMGLELVNWLIIRGARKIIITSRKGVTNGSQALRIAKWQSVGAQIVVSKADILNEEQTAGLLDNASALGDVGGIFNLAAVLNDKIFKKHSIETFSVCVGPKLLGTYNLDKFSRLKCPALDYFVVFSSIASGHGNLGQTNYAFCNSAVERICEQRKADELPALAIEWGAVGNVGMFVSLMDGNIQSSYAGNYMQPIKSCLDVLDHCMNQPSPIIVSCVVAEK